MSSDDWNGMMPVGNGQARLSYTVSQAVAASGIGRTTLYSLMASGRLSYVKLGNRTLIRHVDLEHLLERHLATLSRSPQQPVAPQAIVDKRPRAA